MKVSFTQQRITLRIACGTVLAILPSVAAAQNGVSADPEMVNPRFSDSALPGVSTASTDVKNTVRWGIFGQYELNPVTGYRLGTDVGPIVSNRVQTHLGIAWDATDWLTVRGVLPLVANWGTQVPAFDASGFYAGDISLGAQAVFLKTKHFKMGVDADVIFPSSKPNAYAGETGIRGSSNLLTMTSFGPVDIMADLGVMLRPVQDTGADFELAPELVFGQGFRLTLPWLPLAITQSLHYRGGLTRFFEGGAENSLEILGGIQMPFRNIAYNTHMTLDLMAGRGATQGFGTTDLRIVGGLTFTRNPGRKPRVEIVEVVKPPPPPPPEPDVEPEEWGVGEQAKQIDDRIEIRDPIQFEVDTNNILPESLPVLAAVADVINSNALIKTLIIEGHASEEGSFAYNYKLSSSRAEAVYRQLLMYGVAAERLAWRGRGEVEPKVEGVEEDQLAVNRRVEFHVAAQYSEFDDLPDYAEQQKLAWSGDTVKVVSPLSPDELEEIENERRRAEREEADPTARDFDSGDDDFDFQGEEENKPSEDLPEVEEDEFGDADFESDSDFSFGDEEEETVEGATMESEAPMDALEQAAPEAMEAAEESAEDFFGEAEAPVGEALESAEEATAETMEAATEAVESAEEAATEAVESAEEAATEAVESAEESAEKAATEAVEAAEEVQESAEEAVDEAAEEASDLLNPTEAPEVPPLEAQ